MSEIKYIVKEKDSQNIQGGVNKTIKLCKDNSTQTNSLTLFTKKELLDFFEIKYNEPNTPLIDTAIFDIRTNPDGVLPPYIYDHRTWFTYTYGIPITVVNNLSSGIYKDLENFTPITFEISNQGREPIKGNSFNICVEKGLQIKVKFGNKDLNMYSKQITLIVDCNCRRPA